MNTLGRLFGIGPLLIVPSALLGTLGAGIPLDCDRGLTLGGGIPLDCDRDGILGGGLLKLTDMDDSFLKVCVVYNIYFSLYTLR